MVLVTIPLAVAALNQLRSENKRRLETETLRVCTNYDVDPTLYAALRRIWDASDGGKIYKLGQTEHDVLVVANYLDGIAVGVIQNLYSSEIVKDHLGASIQKFVTKILPAVLGNTNDFEALVQVYHE